MNIKSRYLGVHFVCMYGIILMLLFPWCLQFWSDIRWGRIKLLYWILNTSWAGGGKKRFNLHIIPSDLDTLFAIFVHVHSTSNADRLSNLRNQISTIAKYPPTSYPWFHDSNTTITNLCAMIYVIIYVCMCICKCLCLCVYLYALK